MIELTPIFVLLIIFGFIFGIIYLSVRKKERMVMLEKGADPSIFNNVQQTSAGLLKYGLLLVGVAIGILLGNVLVATTVLEPEVAYFSMIFLLGGIALVISYFLEKQMRKKDQEPDN